MSSPCWFPACLALAAPLLFWKGLYSAPPSKRALAYPQFCWQNTHGWTGWVGSHSIPDTLLRKCNACGLFWSRLKFACLWGRLWTTGFFWWAWSRYTRLLLCRGSSYWSAARTGWTHIRCGLSRQETAFALQEISRIGHPWTGTHWDLGCTHKGGASLLCLMMLRYILSILTTFNQKYLIKIETKYSGHSEEAAKFSICLIKGPTAWAL